MHNINVRVLSIYPQPNKEYPKHMMQCDLDLCKGTTFHLLHNRKSCNNSSLQCVFFSEKTQDLGMKGGIEGAPGPCGDVITGG